MNRPTRSQVVTAIAALCIIITLAAGFGVEGLLAGGVAALAFAVLPGPFAFVIGQLAIGVLAPTRIPDILSMPAIFGAELAVFLALWSDHIPSSARQNLPVAIAVTVLLACIAAFGYGETESLWLTGGVLLASIVTLAYALQRYTVLFVLEEESA